MIARWASTYQPVISRAPRVPRSSSDRLRRALHDTRFSVDQCARDGAKTKRTCALVKREGIRQRQYVNWLSNDLLAIRALGISKHPVTGLEGAPGRRDCDGAGKLGAKHERARRLRLVLSLCLQYLFCGYICEGMSA